MSSVHSAHDALPTSRLSSTASRSSKRRTASSAQVSACLKRTALRSAEGPPAKTSPRAPRPNPPPCPPRSRLSPPSPTCPPPACPPPAVTTPPPTRPPAPTLSRPRPTAPCSRSPRTPCLAWITTTGTNFSARTSPRRPPRQTPQHTRSSSRSRRPPRKPPATPRPQPPPRAPPSNKCTSNRSRRTTPRRRIGPWPANHSALMASPAARTRCAKNAGRSPSRRRPYPRTPASRASPRPCRCRPPYPRRAGAPRSSRPCRTCTGAPPPTRRRSARSWARSPRSRRPTCACPRPPPCRTAPTRPTRRTSSAASADTTAYTDAPPAAAVFVASLLSHTALSRTSYRQRIIRGRYCIATHASTAFRPRARPQWASLLHVQLLFTYDV